MRMRRLGLVATTALAASSTAACMPIACTTIGYSSTLTLRLAEPRDDAILELCVTAGCTPRPIDDPTPAAPDADEGIWSSVDGGGDGVVGWTISIMTGGPAVVYRVLAADGTVIDDGEVEPDWVRVGGSEQCGGPAEAEVVLG